jgi:Protein of unknown function (DUF2905)
MAELGRILLRVGLVIAFLGIVFLLASRWNLPFGRLPGDFAYRGRRVTVYFPLATSLLLSILLTLVFYFIGRFRR